jgi:hypothetical protein
MATAVQIEVSVNDQGVLKGVNDVEAAMRRVASATVEHSKAMKDQREILNALNHGYEVEAEDLQQLAEAQMRAKGTATWLKEEQKALRIALGETSDAAAHQVPMMAAASGAVRELNGTLSVRAAERFLATTLQLGPALQAAFPIVGAIAMLGIVGELADRFGKLMDVAAGMTETVKAFYKEIVEGSNQAFLGITNIEQAHQRLNELNARDTQLNREKAKLQAQLDDTMHESVIGSIADAYKLNQINDQLTKIESDRIVILTNYGKLQHDLSDEARKDAEQDEKDEERRLREHEANLQAFNRAEEKALDERSRLAAKYMSEREEMDKLFNTFENDRLKEQERLNKDTLDRVDRDTIQAVKKQQKDVEEQQRQFKQYTQQLGNDLYSIFNDITSGRIGTLIKQGFNRLFANILAQWIATVQGIGKVSTQGGGGGLIGGLLGSILGIGGGGASGPYGLPGGVAMQFAGSEFGGLSATDFGWSPIGSGGGGDSGSSPIGTVLSTSVGGVSGGVTPRQAGPLGGLLSGANLARLAPLAVLGTLMLGAKGGNSSIAAGGLISAIGLGALYGPSATLTAAAAPFAGFLGPLAGGLVGFGLGQQYGPVAGGLGGAGTGALTGFLAAGPVGAAIGAIVGGLVGLFSGLFGGGPSKHTLADRYINASILPAIQSDLFAYEGFQTDYASVMTDLEKIKSDSYNQMRSQFGKDATNDEWNRFVVPAVQKAEDQINADQAERNRRGSLAFGPPQFATGGIFSTSAASGTGLAVLDNGERVMTPRATRMYGPQLAVMEASARSGGGVPVSTGGGDTYLIQAWDGDSVDRWLRNGGAQKISSAQRRRRIEGHA